MEENSKSTQKDAILAHLKAFGSIEPLTALREYGCYRLSAIIYNLKMDGYEIDTDIMTSINSVTGRRTHYAKYILIK